MENKPTHLIIHCSDSAWGNAAEIDRWHKARGWASIGYHFVVLNDHPTMGVVDGKSDGKVEPGRKPTEIGAHCPPFNARSLGVCLIGKDGKFTTEQTTRAFLLCADLCTQYNIPNANVLGHCEAQPGDRDPTPAVGRPGTVGCPTLDMAAFRAGVAHVVAKMQETKQCPKT